MAKGKSRKGGSGRKLSQKPNQASGPQSKQPEPDAMKRGYARAEAKNQKVREELVPLAPGERPKVVVAAAIWLVVLAALMLTRVADSDSMLKKEGAKQIAGLSPGQLQIGLLALLAIVAAIGLYKLKGWALLGTQTYLALVVIWGSLALLFSRPIAESTKENSEFSWVQIPLIVFMVGFSAYLFFKLIKVMARLQKAERLRRAEELQ